MNPFDPLATRTPIRDLRPWDRPEPAERGLEPSGHPLPLRSGPVAFELRDVPPPFRSAGFRFDQRRLERPEHPRCRCGTMTLGKDVEVRQAEFESAWASLFEGCLGALNTRNPIMKKQDGTDLSVAELEEICKAAVRSCKWQSWVRAECKGGHGDVALSALKEVVERITGQEIGQYT